MKAQDLEMLDGWRHGRLSEAEFEVLQERLREDVALRTALRTLGEVEEGLEYAGAGPGRRACVQA